MNANEQILEHIINYCNEIESTLNYFGKDSSTFEKNFIYANALATPMAQIGELAKHILNKRHLFASYQDTFTGVFLSYIIFLHQD